MDLGAVFLLLAVVVLVGLFISRPFFEKNTGPEGEAVPTRNGAPAGRVESEAQFEHRRSMLLAEQDRLLTALGELDFDHALGKIPEEDYPEQREELLRQGVAILRQLDVIEGDASAHSVEERLERVIAARRADAARRAAEDKGRTQTAGGEALAVEDDLEQLISSQRQSHEESPAGFCPHCGKPVQKSDRFCPRCGGSIAPKKA